MFLIHKLDNHKVLILMHFFYITCYLIIKQKIGSFNDRHNICFLERTNRIYEGHLESS